MIREAVAVIRCDCGERVGTKIQSQKLFDEMRSFFDGNVSNGIFEEISTGRRGQEFYFEETDEGVKKFWHSANRWFKCRSCNSVWEFQYPDFPAAGYVRKHIEETRE